MSRPRDIDHSALPRSAVLLEKDEKNGVYFYQENHGENRPLNGLDLGTIDWLALARQKNLLLSLVWEKPGDPLWGLVHLLDDLQDKADARGYPVVWISDEAIGTSP